MMRILGLNKIIQYIWCWIVQGIMVPRNPLSSARKSWKGFTNSPSLKKLLNHLKQMFLTLLFAWFSRLWCRSSISWGGGTRKIFITLLWIFGVRFPVRRSFSKTKTKQKRGILRNNYILIKNNNGGNNLMGGFGGNEEVEDIAVFYFLVEKLEYCGV